MISIFFVSLHYELQGVTQILKAQIEVLMKTIETLKQSLETQSITIASLTAEIAELKQLFLEKDKGKEELANKLNGLAKIALPKKIERRSYVHTSLKDKTPAPTPKREVIMEQNVRSIII